MKKPSRPSPPSSVDPFTGPTEQRRERFHFQLYITGNSPRSTQAVTNLRALCDEHLAGRYELEVIDLYQEPGRAAEGQVIASPTLVKILPKPIMRMVGSLADREHLKIKLDLSDPPAGARGHKKVPSL